MKTLTLLPLAFLAYCGSQTAQDKAVDKVSTAVADKVSKDGEQPAPVAEKPASEPVKDPAVTTEVTTVNGVPGTNINNPLPGYQRVYYTPTLIIDRGSSAPVVNVKVNVTNTNVNTNVTAQQQAQAQVKPAVPAKHMIKYYQTVCKLSGFPFAPESLIAGETQDQVTAFLQVADGENLAQSNDQASRGFLSVDGKFLRVVDNTSDTLLSGKFTIDLNKAGVYVDKGLVAYKDGRDPAKINWTATGQHMVSNALVSFTYKSECVIGDEVEIERPADGILHVDLMK